MQIQAQETMNERLKERMPEAPTTGKISFLTTTYYLNNNWLFLNKIKNKIKVTIANSSPRDYEWKTPRANARGTYHR